MRPIKTAISSIFVGKTVSYSGLTAFPLKSKRQSALSYLDQSRPFRQGQGGEAQERPRIHAPREDKAVRSVGDMALH